MAEALVQRAVGRCGGVSVDKHPICQCRTSRHLLATHIPERRYDVCTVQVAAAWCQLGRLEGSNLRRSVQRRCPAETRDAGQYEDPYRL